jgi:prolyl-tRNA synthetase
MLQSTLFTKTRKEAPKDELAKNAQLLIRAGFIHKEMAGVYTLLPLGLRVINKITQVVREALNSFGAQEMFLTSLQEKSTWDKSGRWNDEVMDVWFKTKLKNDTELGLAPTHEEPLTQLLKDHVNSYRDLPIYPYQFQTKFRNEVRSKSGILRGREFMMKDLYSFSKDAKEHEAFYEKIKEVYKNIFEKVGLGESTYLTHASGGSFSKYSHEFQTLTDAGEDIIYLCEKCKVAVNKEIYAEQNTCPGCGNAELVEKTAIEVGNIFPLGTRYAEAFELSYLDESGKPQYPVMGSYGIGIGRLMGTIVEVLSDEAGIVWPESVAPFLIHMIILGENEEVKKEAFDLYESLKDRGVEVLLDDRKIRAGEKFADADLIGIPYRLIISEKNIAAGEVEMKERKTGKTKMISQADLQSGDIKRILTV